MSFQSLSEMPGQGLAYYFEVSTDGGATVAYRYGTATLDIGGGVFTEPRIVRGGLGTISRVLTVDHGMATTAFDVRLDNTDHTADWISDRDTYVSQFLGSRWTLTCYVYELASPGNFSTKVLGVYQPSLTAPIRTAESISFTLTDQTMSDLQLVDLPTVRDWIGITDANRPAELVVNTGMQLDPGAVYAAGGGITDYNIDTPVPLLFGGDWHPIQRVVSNCYVVCAVKGAPGALALGLEAVDLGNGIKWNCNAGSETTFSVGGATASTTVFTARRTPTITKGGQSFHLIWLDLALGNAGNLRTEIATLMNVDPTKYADYVHYGVHDFISPRVRGRLWSHPVDDITSSSVGMLPVKIAQDLFTYYCRSAPSIDTSSFTRVAGRSTSKASGSVRPDLQVEVGIDRSSLTVAPFLTHGGNDLIAAVRGLAVAGNFDAFMAWSGDVTVVSSANDYTLQTSTLQTLAEVDCAGFTERIPSASERGAVFNRAYVTKAGVRAGPIDNSASISACGQVFVAEFDGAWIPEVEFADLWSLLSRVSSMDGATVRPRIRVSTWLNGLNYELGQYVTFSWTRGGGASPYQAATFRIEELSLNPLQGTVELDLAWAADFTSAGYSPYVLDDETLSTRASGGVRTCTLTTGSNTVAFSSGSLITDGVAAGDHLIVTDSTEAATSFARNVALIVASVSDATHLVINGTYSSNAFGGGGPFVLSTWEIRRGALTYRANATVYGKVGDSTHAGFFTDGTTYAYRLLEG